MYERAVVRLPGVPDFNTLTPMSQSINDILYQFREEAANNRDLGGKMKIKHSALTVALLIIGLGLTVTPHSQAAVLFNGTNS